LSDERSPAMIALDKSVKERVQQGIEFLREEYGEDWVDHIDMKTLCLSDGSCCVLGQLEPIYVGVPEYAEEGYELYAEEGYELAVNRFGWDSSDTMHEAVGRGFLDGENVTFHDLQREWERVIPNERVRLERKRLVGKSDAGS
jgi:hypothetical protein